MSKINYSWLVLTYTCNNRCFCEDCQRMTTMTSLAFLHKAAKLFCEITLMRQLKIMYKNMDDYFHIKERDNIFCNPHDAVSC